MKNDHVDTILQQWEQERPDLDTSPIAITGRILKLSAFFKEATEKTFRRFNLNSAGFDLLATLLRSGSPYSLSPNELMASTMVTSGTMTNRIDRLVEAGLVSRTQSETDKRSYSIALTEEGYEVISRAIEAHVETLHTLTNAIPSKDKAIFSAMLRDALLPFEANGS